MLGKIDQFFVDIGRDVMVAGRYSAAQDQNTKCDPKCLREEEIIQTIRVRSIACRLFGSICAGAAIASLLSSVYSSQGRGISLLLTAINGICAHDLIRIGLNERSAIAWTQPGQGIGEFVENACNAGKIGFYTLVNPEENPMLRGTWVVGPFSELSGLDR